MADATYGPGVYMEQGGAKLVVTSTGSIQNEGTITNSGAGKIVDSSVANTVGSTAATALLPFGVSVVGSSTGATTYTLAAPSVAGVRKTIVGSSGISGTSAVITTAVNMGHTFDTITISLDSGGIGLIGIPSSTGGAPLLTWGVTGQSTSGAVITTA